MTGSTGVSVINLGCRVNRVESDRISREFAQAGFSLVPAEEAALIVINTCAVTGEAEAKTRAEALMNELSMGFLTGTMEIAGLPPVVPGHMVTLAKINDDFNRDYFITKVVHHMDKEGFETTIHFAGNKV